MSASIVTGIYDQVAKMTSQEDTAYDSIDFSVDDFRKSVGAKRLPTEDKKTLLIRRWREPRLVLSSGHACH